MPLTAHQKTDLTPEMIPRTADLDPTSGGALLAHMKEGVVRLEAIDSAFVALQGAHKQAAGNLKKRRQRP